MNYSPPEFIHSDPNFTTRTFGRKLASGQLAGEQVVLSLTEMLMDVRCDPESVCDDVSYLELEIGDTQVTHKSPLFVPIARVATKGILLRDNDFDQPPEMPKSIDEIIANSTEGVLWESQSGRAYRERITDEIASLLRSLIDGFEDGGMARRVAKAPVRAELEAGLDDVAKRIHSYAALHFIFVSSIILRKAGLASPSARTREVTRIVKNMAKR